MARRPWAVVAAWVALLLVSLALVGHVADHLGSGGFSAPRSAAAFADASASRLMSPPSVPTTLLSGLDGRALAALARRTRLAATWLHPLGPRLAVIVPVGPGLRARGFLAAARAAGASLTAVGPDSLSHAVSRQAIAAFSASTLVAVPALLVLLPLVFGALLPALLPLVTAGAGTVVALAAIAVLERFVPMSVYLLEIVSFLALGVGVDYALFLSSRFRARLEEGADVAGALAESLGTSGRSVLFSGIAVALALSALIIGGTSYWRGLALGGAVAVMSVLLVTHTLLPALLALLGRRVTFGRIPFAMPHWRLWRRSAAWATRRPVAALVVGVALLVAPALLAPGLRASIPADVAAMLPVGTPLARAAAVESEVLGAGSAAPFVVAIDSAAPVTAPATWRTVATATGRLRALYDVARVVSPVARADQATALARLAAHSPDSLGAFVSSRHVVDLTVIPRSGPDSAATVRLLGRMQGALGHLHAARAAIGGPVAAMQAFDRYLAARLPWMALFTALVAFGVLYLATRSVVQAALGVIWNALVAGATAGVLVFTVVHGGFGLVAEPLNMAVAPLVFVLMFGLSMDYEVILLHHVLEHMRAGVAADAAATRAVGATGGMIAGAGLIMVAVVAALLVSPFEILQTLAIGLVSAVVLDTLVVRTFLVPATISLLGRHAFWPLVVHRPAAAAVAG